MRVRLALVVTLAGLALPASATAGTGSISGDAFDSDSGAPLEGLCVEAARIDAGGPGAGTATTGAGGDFTVFGLQPGQYRLTVTDCRSNPEYGRFEVDPIDVIDGHDSCCFNVNMKRFGAISGQAFDLVRNPVTSGLCAEALDEKGQVAGRTEVANGAYIIKQLREGTYNVRFVDCTTTPYWKTQWYYHEYRPDSERDAILPVGVRAGETTTGVDANYVRALPAIEGTITEEGSGTPLAGCQARVWQGDVYVPGDWHSDANGHYEISRDGWAALPPGRYQISFQECDGPWIAEWYDDSYLKETSTWIDVGPRGTAVANASLARGATIRGTLTLHDARPTGLPGVCVRAFRADGATSVPVAGTDRFDNGAYAIEGLPGGSYKVQFARCHDSTRIPMWAAEWWDDVPTFGAGRTVALVRGGDVGGVDATLELGDPATAPATARTAKCVVPKLRGLTLARAKRRLRAAGCQIGRVTRVRRRSMHGRVVGTRVRAGKRLRKGARITVLVAR